MEQHTWQFTIVMVIALLALIPATLHGAKVTTYSLTFLLIVVYWYISEKASNEAVIVALLVILIHSMGAAFDLYTMSFAGVTYDTYAHLLAGFATSLLLKEYCITKKWRRSRLIPFTATMLFGLGVELIEIIDAFFLGDGTNVARCTTRFCAYWQDTIKDLVNDALGAGLALIR